MGAFWWFFDSLFNLSAYLTALIDTTTSKINHLMLYEYSPWTDNTKTISLLDRVACSFVIILQGNIHRDIINIYNYNNTI